MPKATNKWCLLVAIWFVLRIEIIILPPTKLYRHAFSRSDTIRLEHFGHKHTPLTDPRLE